MDWTGMSLNEVRNLTYFERMVLVNHINDIARKRKNAMKRQ